MYKVSVITPFHNVDMRMFSKCVESMRCQTIGYENIEWIIVLHNCEPQYETMLTEMFKDDKNVVMKTLRDNRHSPTTPRNYAMQFVTAPYLGYLDGDDSYTPDCLEVARREMIETKAQVVTFRREYEMESESLQPHTETVLWNQTEWRIVMDRKDFQMDKMFSGLWPFSTSRLFDVEFLRKNNIEYGGEVMWVEDVWHTALCLMKADRLCYLPQFIGYHYYINSGSIIQKSKKDVEDVYECFKSACLIIDLLVSLGVDVNDTAQTMFRLLTRYYLASDLTVEQRRELSNMVAPYLKNLRKAPPSKLYTPEESYLRYHLSKEVLSNPEHPWSSTLLNEAINGWLVMMDIVRKNADTDYGQRYEFNKIETLEDYQKMVPLTDYANYGRIVNLQTKIGESCILTTTPTKHYLVNAKGQYLPCTESHLETYLETFSTILKGHRNLLAAIVGPRNPLTNDGCTVDTLESLMVKKYMWYYHFARGKCRAEFTMPDDLFFKIKPQKELHAICYYGLLDRDVDQIVALNTRRIADMFDYITAHRDELIAELREADKQRADEVAQAFLSEESLAKALWPKLERTVAFGSGEYYDATAHMKEFTGKTPHNNGYYYTEETIYGKAVADDSDLFEAFPMKCFHEHLPLDIENKDTVLYTHTKEGEPYQLVVTNRAGLYRYVTDHIVRIQKKQIGKIIFTIY